MTALGVLGLDHSNRARPIPPFASISAGMPENTGTRPARPESLAARTAVNRRTNRNSVLVTVATTRTNPTRRCPAGW